MRHAHARTHPSPLLLLCVLLACPVGCRGVKLGPTELYTTKGGKLTKAFVKEGLVRKPVEISTAEALIDERSGVVTVALWNPAEGSAMDWLLRWHEHLGDRLPCARWCRLTADRQRVASAHAVLFGQEHLDEDLCGGACVPGKRAGQRHVYWAWRPEPPPTTLGRLNLDWTASYDLRSDLPATYALWGTGTWPREPVTVNEWMHRASTVKPASVGGGQRRATVALVLGECDAAQQAYVRALRTLVDVVSGHHQCDGSTHSAHGGRGVRQRGAGRTVRVEGTKDAQFCLIVEQPTSPEHFMSERLSLALAAGCVPVYHGPGQVELMAPSDAVIDTRSFASAEALGAHLNSLARDEAAYGAHHAWRRDVEEAGASYRDYVEHSVFFLGCHLCERVAQTSTGLDRRESETILFHG